MEAHFKIEWLDDQNGLAISKYIHIDETVIVQMARDELTPFWNDIVYDLPVTVSEE